MSTTTGNAPGFSPTELFERLDTEAAIRLLPGGAYHLIKTLRPDALTGPSRNQTLAELLSLELTIDDRVRRTELLHALPDQKIKELELRIGKTIAELCSSTVLSPQDKSAIIGFFGIATVSRPPLNLPAAETEIRPGYGLFPHQKRVTTAIEHHLYREDRRVMLHLPTGVGKTRIAMSVIASHLRSRENGLIIWLANNRELLQQAATEFQSTWTNIGDRSTMCHRFWGHYGPPSDSQTDGIVLAGLAKLHSFGRTRERLWSLGDRATLIVFDEAHQAVATTYKDLVNTLTTRNPDTALLGLSATPGRTWNDPDLDRDVADLFYGNKVTLDFGEHDPIQRLTRDKYLAKANFSLLNVEPGLQLSSEDLTELAATLDIPSHIAEQLGIDEQRNLRILQRIVELVEDHDRILVFAASVASTHILSSACRALDINADALTGTTDKTYRQHVIQRFRRSDSKKRVLINYGILTTGFDAPAASAVLIARPTRSLVLYSQMVGRVIRGPKAGGTATCEIVTVVDTSLPGFGDVAEAFTNWEDIWTQ